MSIGGPPVAPSVGVEWGPIESEITQFYGTTVVDLDAGHSLTLATLPVQEESEANSQLLDDFANVVGIEIVLRVPTDKESFLSHAFAAVLAPGDPVATFKQLERAEPGPMMAGAQVDIDPTLLAFADYCATAELVPLEQSPLSKAVATALVTAGEPLRHSR